MIHVSVFPGARASSPGCAFAFSFWRRELRLAPWDVPERAAWCAGPSFVCVFLFYLSRSGECIRRTPSRFFRLASDHFDPGGLGLRVG